MATFTGNPAKLVAAPMLQDYLVYKTTGLPLSAGTVAFYHDNDRTSFKDVYYQTGAPGAYTYTTFNNIPNGIVLSSVGTFVDGSGQDTIPFYYPWLETDEDTPDPYYVVIKNSAGTNQFTRENFPLVNGQPSGSEGDQELVNLLPNGQFTSHNDLPAVGTTIASGQVQNGVQQIAFATSGTSPLASSTSVVFAQGGSAGWYYIKNFASTSTDFITFTSFATVPATLFGNPKYSANFICTSSSGSDTFKEFRMRFNNVNRFSSASQEYTFSFAGISNTLATTNVTLKIIKYFGTGGSAPVELSQQIFTLNNGSWTEIGGDLYQKSFTFGSNSASTIGSTGDDYIEVVMALPNNSVYNLSFTDMILTPGSIDLQSYPERPDNMVFANGIAGSSPTPAADGSDLYLPLILTPSGVTFDQSVVGRVYTTINATAQTGELLCDGSQYLTSGYSSDGIPYSRLQSKLFVSAANASRFGTGPNFVNVYTTPGGSANTLIINTNKAGSQTLIANGGVSTTFTVPATTASYVGITGSAGFDMLSYVGGDDTVWVKNNQFTATTGNNGAGTSGFTYDLVTAGVASGTRQTVVFGISALPAAGTYIQLHNGSTQYYFWFKIDGAGADPTPGGTGVAVNLRSIFDSTDVARCLYAAITGYQVQYVATVAGSAIPANSYFNLYVNSLQYYVWYSLNGSGTEPTVVGAQFGIPVSYTAADTSATIAINTQVAINSTYFAVPDLRGMFVRGWSTNTAVDVNSDQRFSTNGLNVGQNIGTLEFDIFSRHNHTWNDATGAGAESGWAIDPASAVVEIDNVIGFSGNNETRPVNMALNYVIKY